MAGDGELRGEAEQLAQTLGIGERVRFLGHRADMPAVMNACDVFVMSSLNEGLGLTAVEAMACGVPVIATNVGGLPEVLRGGSAGVLVEPSASSLAEAAIALINDAGRRSELRAAGFNRARDFDIARIIDRFEQIYEDVLK